LIHIGEELKQVILSAIALAKKIGHLDNAVASTLAQFVEEWWDFKGDDDTEDHGEESLE